MRKTAPSTGFEPTSETKGADFSFVLSRELSDQGPLLLELAKTAFPDLEIAQHSSLQDSLKHDQTGVFVVPVIPPAEALAQRLIDGQNPADALDALDGNGPKPPRPLSQRRRRQIKWRARGPLLDGAAESWAALAAQIGQPAPAPLDVRTPARPGQDGLSQLVAADLLHSAPAAQALAGESEAMIHGPLSGAENSLRRAADVLRQARDQQARLDDLSTERGLLRENLDATLSALTEARAHLDQSATERDQLRQACRMLEENLQQQSPALDAARKMAADADQDRRALGAENVLLRENLALLVAETGTLATRQQTLAKELEARAELEARLSSTSGALVQAEATITQQAGHIARQDAGLHQSRQDIAQLQQVLHSLQQQHEQLGQEASVASETLHQVFTSTSWRATSPLRKIVSRLRSH